MNVFLRILAVARFVYEHRAEIEPALVSVEKMVEAIKADLPAK